jgi:hypothetical protein
VWLAIPIARRKFREAVTQAINSGQKVLGTVMLNPHPFADEIERHPEVETLLVTRDNRTGAMKEVLDRPTEIICLSLDPLVIARSGSDEAISSPSTCSPYDSSRRAGEDSGEGDISVPQRSAPCSLPLNTTLKD